MTNATELWAHGQRPHAEGDEGYDTIRFPLHDDAGRVLRRIDGSDVVTDYEWNGPGGALSAIRYPAAPELDVEFAHDGLGQVIGMTDPTGEHEYERDDLGNLLSVTTTRGSSRLDPGAAGALACQSAGGRPAAGGGCDSNATAGRLRAEGARYGLGSEHGAGDGASFRRRKGGSVPWVQSVPSVHSVR